MLINFLNKFRYSTNVVRKFCCNSSLRVELLENRSIVRLRGAELLGFLQGLITNDIRSLTDQRTSLYTYLLNSKGRILYDVFLCKISDSELLLECDSVIRDGIMKHIKAFCVRKKVDVVSEECNIWVLFNDKFSDTEVAHPNVADDENLYSFLFPENKINFSEALETNVLAFKDPRLSELGVRIISSSSADIPKLLSGKAMNVTSSKSYTTLRYKLGIPEGVSELPVGACFPHEANGDHLHGLSFNKGCYIGQELTARVQHTGVVRKRLMPIIMSHTPNFEIVVDSPVMTNENEKIGKIRALTDKFGIALMRVNEAFEKKTELSVCGISARTYKPFWWPS